MLIAPPSSCTWLCRPSLDCTAISIVLDEPPYTGPYVWWCGRGKPRGFLLPDRLVMSDSTGSFTLTSLRDAGFLRRICYYSARHEAGAVNPICLLKALASCSYGWVVSDTRS